GLIAKVTASTAASIEKDGASMHVSTATKGVPRPDPRTTSGNPCVPGDAIHWRNSKLEIQSDSAHF
ncbi:MAG: hypothetical protein ACPHUF_15570, partial [Gammaproteobacteria bacterium]